jgi:hypothetical protein|eukprot:7376874-Prymnesium_polylepis.3
MLSAPHGTAIPQEAAAEGDELMARLGLEDFWAVLEVDLFERTGEATVEQMEQWLRLDAKGFEAYLQGLGMDDRQVEALVGALNGVELLEERTFN